MFLKLPGKVLLGVLRAVSNEQLAINELISLKQSSYLYYVDEVEDVLSPRNSGAPQNAGFQFLWIIYPLVQEWW